MIAATQKDHGVVVIRPFLQFQTGFIMYPPTLYREQLLRGKWVRARSPEDEQPSADQLRQRKPVRLTR